MYLSLYILVHDTRLLTRYYTYVQLYTMYHTAAATAVESLLVSSYSHAAFDTCTHSVREYVTRRSYVSYRKYVRSRST